MMAFVWMERDRRYFIAASLSLQEGVPYVRNLWRQVDVEVDSGAERVKVSVAHPKTEEVYYSAFVKIDQHNCHRQDTLNLENKLKVCDWTKIVNMTVFAMRVVNEWLGFNSCTIAEETQK